ncbi:MAG: hypothetical protein GXP42_04795 [Chloroflexi bacterium]|nr:hypothetical protein [Chloroflexota bacterium]
MANLRAIVIVLVSVMILASVSGLVLEKIGLAKDPSIKAFAGIAKSKEVAGDCTSDKDCSPPSKYCLTDYQICVECKRDWHCASDEYCSSYNNCVKKKSGGESCDRDRQCSSGTCHSSGKCTPFCGDNSCDTDIGESYSTCPSDCQLVGGSSCDGNGQCDPDETCDCGDCANDQSCQNLQDGSACYQNSQCASGSCVNNICQASGGGDNGGGGQPGGGDNGGGGQNCATPESSVPFYSDDYCIDVGNCGAGADRCVDNRCVWDDPSDLTVACPAGSSCPSYYVPTGWGCGGESYGIDVLKLESVEKVSIPNSPDGEYFKYTIYFKGSDRGPNTEADHASLWCSLKTPDEATTLAFMTVDNNLPDAVWPLYKKPHPEVICSSPIAFPRGAPPKATWNNKFECYSRTDISSYGNTFKIKCGVVWSCRRADGEPYGCAKGNEPHGTLRVILPDDSPPSTTATYTRYKRPAGSQQYGQEDGSISSTGGLQSVSAYAIKAEFSCSDDLSGCFGTKYCVSDSVCQPDKDFSSPVWLGGAVADGQEKAYTVCYSSSDNSGNAEQRKCCHNRQERPSAGRNIHSKRQGRQHPCDP